MELVLLVVQIIVALLLIGSVLLQRSDSDGMGLGGSGGGGGLLSSRGQANLMTRTTAILAFIFMSNSLLLGVISARAGASSLVDQVAAEHQKTSQAPKDGMELKKSVLPKDGEQKSSVPATPATNGAAAPADSAPPSTLPAKTPEAPKAD